MWKKKAFTHRYINNKQHLTVTGNQLKRATLLFSILHFIDARGRPTADLVGEGVIDFYSQGKFFRGKWSKSSEK